MIEGIKSFIDYVISGLGNIALSILAATGYLGIIITMALESACIPLPSEVVMPFSGALAAEGRFDFWAVVFCGTIGNLIGSILAWWVGLKGGRPFIERYGRYVLLSEHSLETAERWFSRYGEVTVFFSRMLPIVRTFISLPAGIGKMPFGRFCLFTFIGAIPWNWLLTWIGFKVGAEWDTKYSKYYHDFQIVIAVLIVVGFVWFVVHHFKGRIKPKSPPRDKQSESTQK
jgi:membrane protein DedA with SNARE-associated domain